MSSSLSLGDNQSDRYIMIVMGKNSCLSEGMKTCDYRGGARPLTFAFWRLLGIKVNASEVHEEAYRNPVLLVSVHKKSNN